MVSNHFAASFFIGEKNKQFFSISTMMTYSYIDGYLLELTKRPYKSISIDGISVPEKSRYGQAGLEGIAHKGAP